MANVLTRKKLNHVLEGLGYSASEVRAADAIEASHEALRERTEKLEALLELKRSHTITYLSQTITYLAALEADHE